MILVTGATGHVGAELVAQLVAAHHPVRAMTRRPDAADDMPPGAQVVYGDATDPSSLDRAFAGAERAFLMSAQAVGSDPEPTHDQHLVNAAQRAGLGHLVKLSVYEGGERDDAIGRWHHAAEATVTGSGLPWTLLRPGRFMSNALQWAPMIRRGDEIPVPFAQRPSASIDPADIAAVAVAALTDDRHAGRAYRLTGPEVLTPTEELGILGELLARPLRPVDPGVDATRAGMVRAGVPAAVVEAIMHRTLHSDTGTEVLGTVATILGRTPTTFRTWAQNQTNRWPERWRSDRSAVIPNA